MIPKSERKRLGLDNPGPIAYSQLPIDEPAGRWAKERPKPITLAEARASGWVSELNLPGPEPLIDRTDDAATGGDLGEGVSGDGGEDD